MSTPETTGNLGAGYEIVAMMREVQETILDRLGRALPELQDVERLRVASRVGKAMHQEVLDALDWIVTRRTTTILHANPPPVPMQPQKPERILQAFAAASAPAPDPEELPAEFAPAEPPEFEPPEQPLSPREMRIAREARPPAPEDLF